MTDPSRSRSRHFPGLFVLLAPFAIADLGTGGGVPDQPLPRPMTTPEVVSSVGKQVQLQPGVALRFSLRVRDRGGDRTSLRLLNPQPGLVFDPAVDEEPPFTRSLRWLPPSEEGVLPERIDLVFEARHDESPQTATVIIISVRRERDPGELIRVGDVTGDGVADVVAAARSADEQGIVNSGRISVWEGSSTPSGMPTATLSVPGASAGDRLAHGANPALQLVDVTGDGVLDVVAVAQDADANGVVNSGAVYVFAGGSLLNGAVTPTATLTAPNPSANDQLGSLPVQVTDLTGDGVDDILTGSSIADVNGVSDVGALWLWEGGSGLSGNPIPVTELAVPEATADDRLGYATGAGVQFADIDGDGIDEVVVAARLADVDGVTNAGAVYVWRGGASLIGNGAPTATLSLSGSFLGPQPGDQLGNVSGQGVLIADVTGDSLPDVLVGAREADLDGDANVGVILVWVGQSDLFSLSNPAILRTSGPLPGDRLGSASGDSILLADLTDDGVLDVLVAASRAQFQAGSLYLWEGGSQISSGNVAFEYSMLGTVGQGGTRLGEISGQGVHIIDVTGDSRLDLLVGASQAEVNGFPRQGAIYFWDGQNGFSGASVDAGGFGVLTVPSGAAGDRLGEVSGPGMQFADVTGDGLHDLIVGAQWADQTEVDSGLIAVWKGESPFDSAPMTVLSTPSTLPGDRLGDVPGQGILIADVTGDSVLDIVAGSRFSAAAGPTHAGAIFVYKGGEGPDGAPQLWAPLFDEFASSGDQLGDAPGGGILIADVTNDGLEDVISVSPLDDLGGGIPNAGEALVWAGGNSMNTSPFPNSRLFSPNPRPNDQLGHATVSLIAADVTDDGVLDVLVASELADEGALNSGAIYLWKGGSDLEFNPEPQPEATLQENNPSDGDRLGG